MSEVFIDGFIIAALSAIAALLLAVLVVLPRSRRSIAPSKEAPKAGSQEPSLLAGIPIQLPPEDRLGRGRIAEALAKALFDYEAPDSLAVGLIGPWGTGKSSLLNLLQFYLGEQTDKAQRDRPILVRFNPWYFPTEDQLFMQFFRTLLSALNRPDLASRYEAARALIGSLASVVGTLGMIPVVGSVATVAGQSMEAVAHQIGARAKQLRDVEVLKQSISEALKANQQRIIVFIDDIDRLTSTEVRLIFKLIKAVADFQYIIYVLAFDRDHVANALSSAVNEPIDDGYKYLEKIVNISVDIPKVTGEQLFQLVVDRINTFIGDRVQSESAQGRRLSQVVVNALPLFETLRELDRLTNILIFNDSLTRGEVDYADLVGLGIIQSVSPKMHRFIRDNAALFVETPETILLGHGREARTADKAALETEIGKHGHPEALRDLLITLFPHVDDILNNRSHGDSDRREWSRLGRACASIENLEVYFQLSVPSRDISKVRLQAILDALDYTTLLQTIDELKQENHALVFLERLKDYLEDERVTTHRDDVVRALLDSSDGFETDLRGFPIHLDGHTLIMQLVYQLLKAQRDETGRFETLERYIRDNPQSLEGIVTQVGVEDQAHARYDLGGRLDPSGQLLTDNHLDSLEGITADLIARWAKSGQLATHSRLTYILLRWADWSSRDITQDYLINTLPDSEFVATVSSLASEGSFDPGSRLSWNANLINRVSDPNLVRERLLGLAQRHDLDQKTSALLERFDLSDKFMESFTKYSSYLNTPVDVFVQGKESVFATGIVDQVTPTHLMLKTPGAGGGRIGIELDRISDVQPKKD